MDRVELFHNLVNLAAADGQFADAEVEFLAERAEHWGIPRGEFDAALAGISAGKFTFKIPEEVGERHTMMQEMLRLIVSDEDLAPTEKHICSMVADKMGLSAADFEQILQSIIQETE